MQRVKSISDADTVAAATVVRELSSRNASTSAPRMYVHGLQDAAIARVELRAQICVGCAEVEKGDWVIGRFRPRRGNGRSRDSSRLRRKARRRAPCTTEPDEKLSISRQIICGTRTGRSRSGSGGCAVRLVPSSRTTSKLPDIAIRTCRNFLCAWPPRSAPPGTS